MQTRQRESSPSIIPTLDPANANRKPAVYQPQIYLLTGDGGFRIEAGPLDLEQSPAKLEAALLLRQATRTLRLVGPHPKTP